MINYRIGNLLTTTDPYIMHGVNCQGVMGSGVALAIKNKWPEVYNQYKNFYLDLLDANLLGMVQPVHLPSLIVFNAFTQRNYGKDNRRYVSYDAIDTCFNTVFKMIDDRDAPKNLSIPKIGAGLGGGKWEVIESIIVANKPSTINVTVWEL